MDSVQGNLLSGVDSVGGHNLRGEVNAEPGAAGSEAAGAVDSRGAGERAKRSKVKLRRRVPSSPERVASETAGWLWDATGDWWLKAVDVGLLAIILLAPLFMGGRGPVGKFVFLVLVATTASIWLARQCAQPRAVWRWSGAEGLLLAGATLVILQLTPLPPAVLSTISPDVEQLLPLWTTPGATSFPAARWSTVSLNPDATRAGLAVFFAYATLFLVVVQRLRTLEDVQRLLRWIGLAVLAMAALGLLQMLLSNGKFLWLYEHPSRTTNGPVKGTFHNQNHFAHFLALGLGPLIWMICFASTRPLFRQLLGVGAGVVAVAGLLTFSRGGVVAISVAAAVCLGIYFRYSLFDRRAWWAIGAVGLVAAAALGIYGYEPLSERMATFGEAESLSELSRGRQALWAALIEAIPHFAWLGSGIGTHRDVYPVFLDQYFSFEFSHGESGYLPLLLEAGVPGLLLMLAGMGLCCFWLVRVLFAARGAGDGGSATAEAPSRAAWVAAAGAVAPGLVASAVHSIGDFVWYISACMSLTILLAACACRLYQLSAQTAAADVPGAPSGGLFRGLFAGREANLPRGAWLPVAVTVVLIAWGLVYDRHHAALAAPHFYDYLRVALPARQAWLSDPHEEMRLLDEQMLYLERAVARDPRDPRANLKLAGILLRRFELDQLTALNPMPLSQIRDAAIASRFESRAKLDEWLAVAVGENRWKLQQALAHCRRGLSSCPLHGEGYLYLAELSFLEGPSSDPKRAYATQARIVRPHSGKVQFALGAEALLDGRYAEAVEHWKEAFASDPEAREMIIDSAAGATHVGFFLDNFALDGMALDRLFRRYRAIDTEQAQLVGRRYLAELARLRQDAEPWAAADYWARSARIHGFLGEPEQQLACARQVVALRPQGLAERQALAEALMSAGLFAEAVEQYQWCARRDPENTKLAAALIEAQRQAIRLQASAPPVAAPAPGRY